MKQLQIRKWKHNILPIVLLCIAHLKYVPLFRYPSWLNTLYYENGLLIYLISFSLTITMFYVWRKKNLTTILCSIIFVCLLLSNEIIKDKRNKLIISVNEQNDTKDFYSPFVGVEVERKKKEVNFKFEKIVMTQEILKYGQHNLSNLNENEIDASVVKIYSKFWILTNEGD